MLWLHYMALCQEGIDARWNDDCENKNRWGWLPLALECLETAKLRAQGTIQNNQNKTMIRLEGHLSSSCLGTIYPVSWQLVLFFCNMHFDWWCTHFCTPRNNICERELTYILSFTEEVLLRSFFWLNIMWTPFSVSPGSLLRIYYGSKQNTYKIQIGLQDLNVHIIQAIEEVTNEVQSKKIKLMW